MTESMRLRERHIQNTDYAPFWWRLNELGFRRGIYYTREYKIRGSPFVYIRTIMTFINGTRSVELRISRHGTRLIIRRNKQVELRTDKMPSANWLESPFIKYFGEKPLWLRRIGRQPQNIQKWLHDQTERRIKRAIRRGLPVAKNPILNLPNYMRPPATPAHKRRSGKSKNKPMK